MVNHQSWIILYGVNKVPDILVNNLFPSWCTVSEIRQCTCTIAILII